MWSVPRDDSGLMTASDYHGARNAGMHALLIRRPGMEGDAEAKEEGEDLRDVHVIHRLSAVVDWVRSQNGLAACQLTTDI